MSTRHRRTGQRAQAARGQATIRYVYGKQNSQRVQAAREQAILRYV